MRWHRFAVAGALVFGLALVASAGGGEDNAKKILGKWELAKSSGKGPPAGTMVHFSKDGKLKIQGMFMDKEFTLEGTYKIKGDKLTVTLNLKGEEKTDSDTIKTLTKDRLVLEDKDGKVNEFKRVVGEKKKKTD